MPPRSITDATRFTPTVPHASETSAERVARLRAASRRQSAEASQGTLFERLVDRGRPWADKAHRAVAFSLIGATVVCAGITVYAYTDMVMYNRKKRAELVEQEKGKAEDPGREKEGLTVAAVAAATAPAADVLTGDIAEMEERERDREKEANRVMGPVESLKKWAMSGLTPAEKEVKSIFEREEEKAEAEGRVVAAVAAPREEVTKVVEAVPEKKEEEQAKPTSGGWKSWFGGKK